MSAAVALGLAAGLVQAAAYLVYLRQVVRAEVAPNGMTWGMWSYGTLVFFVIEADIGAPLSVLILPGICTACGIAVAGCAFARARYLAPEPRDWACFAVDAALIAGYVGIFYGVFDGVEPSPRASIGMTFFLLASLSTITSSLPILRTTYLAPEHERPAAWFVWSAAYALMWLAARADGLGWPFQLYPALSLAVHLAIGGCALPAGRRRGLSTP